MKLPQAGDRKWYSIKAKEGKSAEVFIFDEIGRGFFGGGIAADDFIKDVKDLKLGAEDSLTVRINSPGGSVFEGIAIHNYLRTLKAKVIARVDGVAASIASVIAMAGDRIEMPENSMMMIHNPMMLAIGNAEVMRKAAEDLDKIRESMASSYLRKAGDKLDRESLFAMLDAETWLGAQDAVDKGLADVVDEPVRAAATFDFARYGFKVPQALVITNDIPARRERLRVLTT